MLQRGLRGSENAVFILIEVAVRETQRHKSVGGTFVPAVAFTDLREGAGLIAERVENPEFRDRGGEQIDRIDPIPVSEDGGRIGGGELVETGHGRNLRDAGDAGAIPRCSGRWAGALSKDSDGRESECRGS